MKNNATKTGRYTARNESEAGSGSMNNDLHDLFLKELADMYNAEQQLAKALPKMAKAAESSELKDAFQSHLEETQQHVSRLQEVFQSLGESAKGKKCKGMDGLITEGEEMLKEMKETEALDASLIVSAQKVEHYEIASYGSLCAWAAEMGHDRAAELLRQNLDEEKADDEKLTEIAESTANEKAEQVA